MFPFAGRRLALRGTTIRLIGLDRRVTILFRAQRDAVLILRVLYAGRQP
jgi:plasmid stabilization system protein ParE